MMNQTANLTSPKNGCSETTCNEHGRCVLWSPGELIETVECLCDLWHTGQRCEHLVPLPIVASGLAAVITFGLLFFWIWTARRFDNRKMNVRGERIRFVDFLNEAQRFERNLLLDEHSNLISERYFLTRFNHGKLDSENKTAAPSQGPTTSMTKAEFQKLEKDVSEGRQTTTETGNTGNTTGADTGVTSTGTVDVSEKVKCLVKMEPQNLVPEDATDAMLKDAKKKQDASRDFQKQREKREKDLMEDFEAKKKKQKEEKSQKKSKREKSRKSQKSLRKEKMETPKKSKKSLKKSKKEKSDASKKSNRSEATTNEEK